jgi:hypothetical protein
MAARGLTEAEVVATLRDGWPCSDAQESTDCRVFVFPFAREWEGRYFDEKEVTVYFKRVAGALILLTAIARYGSNFPRQQT